MVEVLLLHLLPEILLQRHTLLVRVRKCVDVGRLRHGRSLLHAGQRPLWSIPDFVISICLPTPLLVMQAAPASIVLFITLADAQRPARASNPALHLCQRIGQCEEEDQITDLRVSCL